MTVNAGLGIITYAGDGKTKNFPYPYKFFDQELAVYINKTFKTYQKNIDYAIIGSGNANGGEIAFVSAPPEGEYITISRDVALNQMVKFIEGEDFPATDYEYSLDRMVMALQEFKSALKRAWIVAPGAESPEDFIESVNTELALKANAAEVYAKGEADGKFALKADIPSVIQHGEVILPPTTWQESADIEKYPYKSTITVQGVTSSMQAIVAFSAANAASGNLAPVSSTGANAVSVYAQTLPEEDVKIVSIMAIGV